ncbi:hypothetical protein [Xenorhabdus koppenhoeferi]|uniref:Uncharacterized protein n=1 Tax=Xenorhabdus koppenhoeferi TaxID=351659 RepID=A0A1I7JQB0_9GAMM|nr:hypothetical protein [Xenorhabdus koppenhoeferi]SFU87328.1 hypothetical protein SAMN05421784_13710 [Xenorhabdus koppenhoeferi]
MKLKVILKWCFSIIFTMIGLLYIAHFSLNYPEFSEGLGEEMYKWRYFWFLWRILLYVFIGRFLWKLWYSPKISLESRNALKRIMITGTVFILVSEIVVWMNEGVHP